MTDREQDQAAIETAGHLTAAMDGVRSELRRLNSYGRRNRHLIWMMFASIALDVALTLLLVFAYGTARNSDTEARAAQAVSAAEHVNLVEACEQSNQSRAAQVLLWDHLAQISTPPPHLTAAQLAADRRKIAELLAYIRHVFAPKDCARAYRVP